MHIWPSLELKLVDSFLFYHRDGQLSLRDSRCCNFHRNFAALRLALLNVITLCDEIESFSVVGYQPFESQLGIVLNLELYLFANRLIQLIKAMFCSTSQLF